MEAGLIQELFERMVDKHPDNIAITNGYKRVIYRQLEEEANRLANFLMESGAEKGSIIASFLQDPSEVITTILAAMKSGLVFVIFDTEAPAATLQAMIEAVSPRWFVTESKFIEKLRQVEQRRAHESRIVCLDGDAAEPEGELSFVKGYRDYVNSARPQVSIDPDGMAYIYFTSGTTGTPKAVAGRYRAIDHAVRWEIEILGLGAGTRASQLHSLSFDESLRDIFVPLCVGGTLCVPESRELILDGARLTEWINAQQIEVIHCTPSLLRNLLSEELHGESFSALRCVLSTGEALLPDDVARWVDVFGDRIQLLNLYGTSETTLAKFCYFVKPEDKDRSSIPIGKPIAGVRALVVGEDGMPCPVKLVGEIYIRTPYRSLGYYHQPQATDEVFIKNPFSANPEDIVYKTGDLGRVLEDGNYEYVGRKNSQVEIRGTRVEVSEIESLMRSHKAVRDVAVVSRENGDGNNHLYAYVVPKAEIRPGELRQLMADYLPDYMIPSRLMIIERLPLTLSGKVDRLALPKLEGVQTPDELAEPQVSSVERQTIKSQPLEHALRGGELAPLSYSQQRLWFFDQLEPGNPAYNIATALQISGALNVAVLEQTRNEIERRHEVLRTSFFASEGKPVQCIVPPSHIKLPIVDLSGLSAQDRQAQAESLAKEEARHAFELSQGPLWRTSLLRLAEREHLALFTMHHIVSDGWSVGVLINEVRQLYTALGGGQPSPLAELRLQYSDYAQWQRQWQQGEALARELSYWKQQLAGAPAVLELPLDRVRPAVQSYRGGQQEVALGEAINSAVEELSRRAGVTKFMVLLAAFKALLVRYTGQVDIVIGTNVANRQRVELEGLIGFFVNMLVLRTDCGGDPSFEELLGRVREVTLQGYMHQEVPFEKLVEQQQPERHLSHSPVFQVLFNFQNAPVEELELSGLEMKQVRVDNQTAKYDLTFFLWEGGSGLAGTVEYNQDLFEARSIRRLIRHYERLLAGAVAAPEQRLSQLPLLTVDEQQARQQDDTASATAALPASSIQALIEQQAAHHSERVAVECGGEWLTYGELDRRANQVGQYLRRLGVGAGVLVGICVEHSLEEVIGMLGVLKAGGGYVPLDAEQPGKRMAKVLADAQVPILLTQQHLAGQLPQTWAQVICLDSDWGEIEQESSERPANAALADSLAYVIYTSGSTGKPKGVAISQAALVNYITWAAQAYLSPGPQSFALYSSAAFDLTVTSLYLPLISGNLLRVYRVARQQMAIEEVFSRGEAEIVKLTPSHLGLVKGGSRRGSHIKKLIVGGEAFERQLAQEVSESFGGAVEIYNEYGPTEATVGCMIERFEDSEEQARRATVAIGRAAQNMRVYVLDQWLNLVGENVIGELYIGGVGLAQGYVGEAAQTAEKFVPDVSGGRGERLYRTGDLGRYLADGRMEYVGRADGQVKVRGYRVEMGEIEAVMRQCEGVKEAVVKVQQGDGGEGRLVGYVEWEGEEAGAGGREEELRKELSEELPGWMVPEGLMSVGAMPLTSNGKVDRRALPKWERSAPKLETTFVAPQTQLQRDIAAIWRKVLGLEQVGIHDNFFELGGHSLLLAQVHSKLERLVKREFSVLDLFEYPTISTLANYLGEQGSKSDHVEQEDLIQKRGRGLNRLRLRRSQQQRAV